MLITFDVGPSSFDVGLRANFDAIFFSLLFYSSFCYIFTVTISFVHFTCLHQLSYEFSILSSIDFVLNCSLIFLFRNCLSWLSLSLEVNMLPQVPLSFRFTRNHPRFESITLSPVCMLVGLLYIDSLVFFSKISSFLVNLFLITLNISIFLYLFVYAYIFSYTCFYRYPLVQKFIDLLNSSFLYNPLHNSHQLTLHSLRDITPVNCALVQSKLTVFSRLSALAYMKVRVCDQGSRGHCYITNVFALFLCTFVV